MVARDVVKWRAANTQSPAGPLAPMGKLETAIDRASREVRRLALEHFHQHKHRMDYKTGQALGQPVGSGASESTGSEYQRRFKLTGQFWTLAGEEACLALATLSRHGRWNQLFPHDASESPQARNAEPIVEPLRN